MNPYQHASYSVKKRGGKIEDYYPIHFFMDATKELCSDNRHRILHNLWGIRRIVIPIFGVSLVNSDGKRVNIKDLCEQDHVLLDYSSKFIPTLADFVTELTELTVEEQTLLNSVHTNLELGKAEMELMLSPLSITGQLKSLLITHNSWFIYEILPKVTGYQPPLTSFEIPASLLFDKMNFALWMDNGTAFPPSCNQIATLL